MELLDDIKAAKDIVQALLKAKRLSECILRPIRCTSRLLRILTLNSETF